ncbi:hypothetical protein EIP86_007756 [Pleurotus ostreatoroseus]|nr:hypothetical protein EIP86_007756 [Pleurotus ostreatoroseus]
MGLHYMGLATSLKRARQEDLNEAKLHMAAKRDMPAEGKRQVTATRQPNSPSWTMEEARAYAAAKLGRCVLVLDDYVVDATTYLSEHPGGALILRKYALSGTRGEDEDKEHADISAPMWKQATWAFGGGLNNHSRAAKRRLEELVVARVTQE